MQSNRNAVIARNLFVGAGAYYLSRWLVVPLVLGFGKMTRGLIYSGEFNGKIVSRLVEHFPLALVAFVAGVTIAWLIESDSPIYWALFPAIQYGIFTFLGYHRAVHPDFLDRVGQTLGAMFPAVTCLLGALVGERRLRRNVVLTPSG